MKLLSQHFQQVAKKYSKNPRGLPNILMKAAEEYHPRLGILLRKPNQRVFESDLEMLANFFQTHDVGKQYSPNVFQPVYHVQARFHKEMQDKSVELDEIKHEKPAWKLKQIEHQLDKLRHLRKTSNDDPEKLSEIDLVMKRANIRRSRKISDRQGRAKEFVADLIKSKESTNKKISGANKAAPQRLDLTKSRPGPPGLAI